MTPAGAAGLHHSQDCVAELVGKPKAMPVIPHSNTAHEHFEQCQPYQFWIDGTLELLRRCDAVILTDDWERSSGARGEAQEAHRLGMPVFHGVEGLRVWLATWDSA